MARGVKGSGKAAKVSKVSKVSAVSPSLGGLGSDIEKLIRAKLDEILASVNLPKGAARSATPVEPPKQPAQTSFPAVPALRQRGSFQELEQRAEWVGIITGVLKQEGVLVKERVRKGYRTYDLTLGNLAWRGRHLLVRQFNIAPEHVANKKLPVGQETSTYFMGAISVINIDDFKDAQDVRNFAVGMAQNIKARLSVH